MLSSNSATCSVVRTRYRPDIDGLRAIAVVSVVLDHAFDGLLPGGFTGVDIFYVISGYLITNILLNDLKEGRFSIVAFYAHRARRILPALLAVLVVTTAFAACLLPPRDLSAYGDSVVATALFASNFYFYATTGYFSPDAQLLPLLHTWSLAVEEQYYLFFPPFLWAAWRLKAVRSAILLVLSVSLLLSILLVGRSPTLTFFLAPTRVWELLVGAVIATRMLSEFKSMFWREVGSLTGAALIVAGLCLINSNSIFPGAAALLPCLGTGLIIHAGLGESSTLVGRLLSFRPVVFIGLISYSLYLWHWPVISLLHYRFNGVTPLLGVIAIILSFALATLSWMFIERRFHRPASRGGDSEGEKTPTHLANSRVVLLGLGCLLVVTLIGAGLGQLRSIHLVRHVYPADIALLNEASARTSTPADCKGSPTDAIAQTDCRIGDPAKPASIALWGDSYADALRSGLPSILRTRSAYGLVLHSCQAILGVHRVDARPDYRDFAAKCTKFNRDTVKLLKDNPKIETVILFSNYKAAYNFPGRAISLSPDGRPVSPADRMDRITDRIIETARTLKASGKTVVLVGSFYSTDEDGALHLARMRMHDPEATQKAKVDMAIYDTYSKRMNDRLRAASDDRILFVDPKPMFCSEKARICDYYQGSPPLADDGHLNQDGANQLSGIIAQTLRAHGKNL